MKITISVIFLFYFSFLSFPQNEASVWCFVDFAGLDFRNEPPMLLKEGEIQSDKGCSTISNKDGKLLFYTNGVKVWNKNHEIMVNDKDSEIGKFKWLKNIEVITEREFQVIKEEILES